MPWSNWARVPQLLSLRSRACKPQLLSPRAATTEVPRLEPVLRNKGSHCNEKPLLAATRESPHAATKTQHS